MTTETKQELEKITVLERVPPGDRWTSVQFMENDDVFDSLTEALEFHFQQTGETEYFISAKDGIVSVVKEKEVEVPKKITKYSLYGEE